MTSDARPQAPLLVLLPPLSLCLTNLLSLLCRLQSTRLSREDLLRLPSGYLDHHLKMAASTSKVSAKISALDASLDELEAKLEPLFAQTLPESVVGLDKIQQAKLQVALPYLVYDLVFSA